LKQNLVSEKSDELYLKSQKDKFTEIFEILDGDNDGEISLKAI
jgi:Ca2+-binding EF-hand superfamily protein